MTMAVPYRNEPVCHLVRDKLLHERFLPLWRRCLSPVQTDNAESIWEALSARYSEPHRYYHDSSHLAHCMEQLDTARGSIAAPDEVEMAIWFHDVVNQPGQGDR